MSQPDCPICLKHRGEGELLGPVLIDSELVLASLRADGPPGYAFVETRRQVGGLESLTPEEAEAFGRTTARLARALAAELAVERVHTFIAGLGVDHLHQHVYVRPAGTPADAPWWPPTPVRPDLHADDLAPRLRRRLV